MKVLITGAAGYIGSMLCGSLLRKGHEVVALDKLKDLSFGGDMRDIRVSFDKIRRQWGFVPAVTVRDGVRELRDAILGGLIQEPNAPKYRNAQFIVQ